MGFADHFSKHSHQYARYRPVYPAKLFTYLASIAPSLRLAWDCGTGNGQAAIGLAQHFDRVIATDASQEQIAHARPHPRVVYRIEPAEDPCLDAGSADLITAGTAVHWFDLQPFYQTVRRVLSPGGVLAVWMYHLPQISAEVDPVLTRLYEEELPGFWPERFEHVASMYRSLPFPFEELSPPHFTMRARWTLNQLAGFITSWSAVQRCLAQRGENSLQPFWRDLETAWGDPQQRRTVRWPLFLRVGRVEKGNQE